MSFSLHNETIKTKTGQEEQFAFKRALSRLIEMTSPTYSRTAQWAPLPEGDRNWERSPARAGTSQLHTRVRDVDPSPPEPDDFASEAAYLPPSNLEMAQVRPPAPRLKPDHMWGVRDDWGKGTTVWGQGAKAYENGTVTQKK